MPKSDTREESASKGSGTWFAQIPWELQDADWVTAHTIAVYAALHRYTDFGGETGARPPLPTLASKAHMSRSQVHRELEALRKHGWITWTSGGPGRANHYTVYSSPRVVSGADVVPGRDGIVSGGDGVVSGRDGNQCQVETLPRANNQEPLPRANTDISDAEEFSAEFVRTWDIYPKRLGGNSKKNAYKAWRAQIKKGVTPADIHAGVERYAAHQKAINKIGTPYIMQGSTFFGPGDHFRESWALSTPKKSLLPNGELKQREF